MCELNPGGGKIIQLFTGQERRAASSPRVLEAKGGPVSVLKPYSTGGGKSIGKTYGENFRKRGKGKLCGFIGKGSLGKGGEKKLELPWGAKKKSQVLKDKERKKEDQ